VRGSYKHATDGHDVETDRIVLDCSLFFCFNTSIRGFGGRPNVTRTDALVNRSGATTANAVWKRNVETSTCSSRGVCGIQETNRLENDCWVGKKRRKSDAVYARLVVAWTRTRGRSACSRSPMCIRTVSNISVCRERRV